MSAELEPGTKADRPGTRPLGSPSGTGLSEQEAARRLAARGRPERLRTSRSYASIVRANVFTVFNVILAGFGTVTLIFGDWRDALFLGVIVANSAIGITQETRAKRALDRLSLLVAPRALVVRDGVGREVPVAEIVPGDVVMLAPGDQLSADGRLLEARELRLDESILSGESEPATKAPGEEVRSGAFVTDGTGAYEVTAVGAESFAARLTGQARSFRHPRSPLQRAIDRLLYGLVVLVIALGGLLGYSLYHRHVPVHTAVATSVAGVVSLIPEGLVVLVSLTYAVAAVRMSRRGVLAQQLNAIESLASVDTICMDKTGTLTEATLRIVEVLPAPDVEGGWLQETLGTVAASSSSQNMTMRAIADAFPGRAESPLGEIPFSSRRRFSAVAVRDGVFYLGAPERFSPGPLASAAEERQREGRRVLAVAHGRDPLGDESGETPPPDLRVLGLVVLAEELRPGAAETIAFLRARGRGGEGALRRRFPDRGCDRSRRRHPPRGRQRRRGDALRSRRAGAFRHRRDGGGSDLAGGKASYRGGPARAGPLCRDGRRRGQ